MNDLEPMDRNIAMVFQSYALYPTMTVEKNITFGMKVRGLSEELQQKKWIEVSKQLQIENLLKNFTNFLITKRRFFFIEQILNNFIEICSEKRGELKTEIRSAKRLSNDEINNIKDFWGTFNNIPKPTQMFSEPGIYKKVLKTTGEVPGAISLFRKNSYPTWEDPKNCDGGCFSFKVLNKNVPSVWKDLSYVLTGETVSNDSKFQERVTGITISPKKSFCILKIWMKIRNLKR